MFNRIASQKEPRSPWPLPNFNALHIDDFNDQDKLNLPPGIEQSNPFAIFSKFFADKVMDQLPEWTNTYAEKQREIYRRKRPSGHAHSRTSAGCLISSDLTPRTKCI